MVLKSSQERVKTLLKDTITLLCKNGLEFKRKFNVEALIGVTLDDDEVFLISMNELVKADGCVDPENVNTPDTTTSAPSQSKSSSGQKRKHESRDIVKVEPKDHPDPPDDPDAWDTQTGSAATSEGTKSDEHKAEPQPKRKATRTEMVYEKDTSDEENYDNDNDSDTPVIIKEEASDSFLQSISQEADDSFPMNFSEFPQDTSMSGGSGGQGAGGDNSMLWAAGPSFGQQAPRQTRTRFPSSTATSGDMSQQDYSQSDPQQQQHSADPSYSCETCGKVYSSRSSWRSHRDWHAGKFKYHCKICSRGFRSSIHLRGHMVSHTGQREFKCDVCGKFFVYKQQLKYHMQNVHGVSMTTL